jgi:parvulin-like peptidyl-prolyl isomerase
VGAKAGQRGKQAPGRQRLALILFGSLFVLLFVGFAVAQGITPASVPSGDVARISGVPDEFANISEDELKASIDRAGASEGKKAPKPGSDKYEELQTGAMTELIESVWIRGEAEELDVSVTDKQVEDELKTIKKQNFPTEAAYQKFLEKSNYTEEEVNELVEVQLLTRGIQEKVNAEAPKPSSEEIEEYYDAEKASQFTTKESRDVRIVLNEDKAEVEAAKKALEADNSPASWKKVAAKYSSDPTSKTKGGLQKGVTEEFLQGQLKEAIFSSATGELVGPLKFEKNWMLTEVVKLNPGKVQTLGEAKAQIEGTLEQEKQQTYLGEFANDFQSKWLSRTRCADGFVTERCANYVSGHPASASPACYEADPKTPATECPSPVTPISPALPGTVTLQKPKGEPFPQRPRPEATPEQGEEVATPPVPTGE